jgi:two-component system chemotaxis response regulator CheY
VERRAHDAQIAAMTPDPGQILVIDDEADSRMTLRSLLADAGYEAVEACDGESAIHYLTSKNGLPALIVTDLAMPDMSGWELINVLQAYVRLSSIPVLVVSAMGLHDRPVRDEGVLEFFPKPLDADRFLTAVRRHAVSASERDSRRNQVAKKLTYSPF